MAAHGRRGLGELIRARKESILDGWERRVRTREPARRLSRERFLYQAPGLLDHIATIADDLEEGGVEALPHLDPETYGHERLFEGFDLGDVIAEIALLQDSVLRVCDGADQTAQPTFRALHHAIDAAIMASMARHLSARDRAVSLLDRAASLAAFAACGVEDLLGSILRVLTTSLPAANTIAILLRERGRLVIRSVAGVAAAERGASLAVGEGLAGRVAAENRPLLVPDAAESALVAGEEIGRTRIRALYGVPLRDGREVVGVACMGSLTSEDFAEQDKRLFEAMARRAAAAVVRRGLRADIERRAAELTAVIENVPEAVIVVDAAGTLKANRSALELFGITQEDVETTDVCGLFVRLDFRDAKSGESVADEMGSLSQALAGGTVDREVVCRHAETGRPILLRAAGIPIRSNHEVIGAVLVATDVPQRKRAELDLRDAARFRERFIAILGHDLRNPLNAIKLGVQSALADPQLSDPLRATLLRVSRSTRRMERMVRDVVDFARGRVGGGIPIRYRPLALRDIVHAVVEELRVAHAGRTIRLEAPVEGRVSGDGDRLAQAVSNLVANALQHGAPDEPITVRLLEHETDARIEVHNVGRPIPPDMLSCLFDPFRKAGRRHPAGLGLGLYIVMAIVEAHHGTVDVESTAEKGTTFTITLPRNHVPEGGTPGGNVV
jgi:PAS domain S-box-containing protein